MSEASEAARYGMLIWVVEYVRRDDPESTCATRVEAGSLQAATEWFNKAMGREAVAKRVRIARDDMDGQ